MKVLTILGTRPEVIKLSPVILKLKGSKQIDSQVCFTRQHRDLADHFLEYFGIDPDFDLDVATENQTLSGLTAALFTSLDEVLTLAKPDLVVVHGDTTTAMVGALSGFYKKIAVAHVEAGLRTGNIYSPWPEEMNRKVIGTVARYNFAPTELAAGRLRNEGVHSASIRVTGNTVIDALFATREYTRSNAVLMADMRDRFSFLDRRRRTILVTGHRRENFGKGFENICDAIRRLVDRDDVQIVFPVHLNPNVKGPVGERLGGHQHIHLIEPLDYVSFLYLMDRSYLVLTDSGGVQEEAPSLGKPVVVMRDTTERPEAVEAGTVVLAGASADAIFGYTTDLLDDSALYERMSQAHNPYGDGHAADRILETILGGSTD